MKLQYLKIIPNIKSWLSGKIEQMTRSRKVWVRFPSGSIFFPLGIRYQTQFNDFLNSLRLMTFRKNCLHLNTETHFLHLKYCNIVLINMYARANLTRVTSPPNSTPRLFLSYLLLYFTFIFNLPRLTIPDFPSISSEQKWKVTEQQRPI